MSILTIIQFVTPFCLRNISILIQPACAELCYHSQVTSVITANGNCITVVYFCTVPLEHWVRWEITALDKVNTIVILKFTFCYPFSIGAISHMIPTDLSISYHAWTSTIKMTELNLVRSGCLSFDQTSPFNNCKKIWYFEEKNCN